VASQRFSDAAIGLEKQDTGLAEEEAEGSDPKRKQSGTGSTKRVTIRAPARQPSPKQSSKKAKEVSVISF
jgi:hypothetical protein